jgi:hypothetical protein
VPNAPSFPRPSTERCPECGGRVVGGRRCTGCDLVLAGRDARRLWRIDYELYRLCDERQALIRRLRARSQPAASPTRAPVGTAPTGFPPLPGEGSTDPGPPPPPLPQDPGPTGAGPQPLPPPPRSGPPGDGPHGGPPPAGPLEWPGYPIPALTVPNLLLGLGTSLIVVAAIVFTAVRWSQLGATVQGLVLVGVTGLAGWATRAVRRHELAATAEALSVVTVALFPVDVHALREAAQAFGWTGGPGGDPLIYWCLAIWVLASITWWFGRATGTQAPRIMAAVAAQVPLLLYVLARPVEGAGGQLLCLAQAAVSVVVARRAARAVLLARAAAVLGSAGTWSTVIVVAAVSALDGGPTDRLTGAGVLAAAAAVAGLVAALWRDDDTIRPLGAGTATGVGLAAVWIGASATVTGDAWWPVAAAPCALVLAGALRVPRAWGDAPALVGGVMGALASLPFVAAALDGVAMAMIASREPWGHDLGTTTHALAEGMVDPPTAGIAAAHLAVLAFSAVAVADRVGRQVAVGAAGALALGAVIAVPAVVDLPVWAATATTLVAAHIPMFWVTSPGGVGRSPLLLLVTTGTSALALLWSSAAPATTVVAVGAVGVLGAWVAGAALRDDGPVDVALAAASAAVVAACAEVGLVVAALGGEPAAAWSAGALAAAAATCVGASLDPAGTRTDLRGVIARLAEATAAAAHVVALAGAADAAGAPVTSVLLAAGAATATVHAAVRPGRQVVAATWAAAEALAVVWLQLAHARVDVPEAYTLPVAVAFLSAALLARRSGLSQGQPSWTVHGPWLVAALGPTVALALDDPGLVRPLGGLVAGVVVLVAGAISHRRAPVDVGAATVAVLGLRQLSPVVADLPNWATLGSCGLVLLAVGATFEQRRRDLGRLRDLYGALE